MQHYYFDTNPLLRWAEARTAGRNARCQRIAAEVERLIDDTTNVKAISEITLAEFQNQLSTHERDNAEPSLDSSWHDQCLDTIMGWIVGGHLKVLEPPPNLIEKAMAYVRFATREKSRNFRAWDAAHLYQACHWARSIGTTVQLVTSDEDFRGILDDFPEFQRFVRIYNPDTGALHP